MTREAYTCPAAEAQQTHTRENARARLSVHARSLVDPLSWNGAFGRLTSFSGGRLLNL
jgi:hypothetical protein